MMTLRKTDHNGTSLNGLQTRGKIMVGFLVLQYVVGMVLGFFIKLPAAHPGTSGSYFVRLESGYIWSITGGGGFALATHVLLATGLAFGSLALLGYAIAARHKAWLIASSIGLIGITLAWLDGMEFINTGFDKYSFAMAISLMIALFSYGAGLYVAKHE